MLVSAIAVISAGSTLGLGRTADFDPPQPEMSDTAFAAARDSTINIHWLTIDIVLGKQFLSPNWQPYSKPLFVGGSCQRRFGQSPLWLDASILVGRAGGVDVAGAGNGPGVSLVDLRAGIGHWWDLGSSPLSFFVSGGVSFVWAQLHLWEGKQEGHFWGGYARSGITMYLSEELYIGIGLSANISTSGTLANRNLNINSTAITLSVGARQ